MGKELNSANRIFFNLKEPEIKKYFGKESWIPIDQKLKRRECPTGSEFYLFDEWLGQYRNGVTEGIPLMIFLRMHFDMIFSADCFTNAKEIRDSFKSFHHIRKNKYSEALYLTMLADYKLLEEGKSCSLSEAYDLYDKVDGYIGTEINAEWIRQEIEYRMERIRGNSELERSSGDCKE